MDVTPGATRPRIRRRWRWVLFLVLIIAIGVVTLWWYSPGHLCQVGSLALEGGVIGITNNGVLSAGESADRFFIQYREWISQRHWRILLPKVPDSYSQDPRLAFSPDGQVVAHVVLPQNAPARLYAWRNGSPMHVNLQLPARPSPSQRMKFGPQRCELSVCSDGQIRYAVDDNRPSPAGRKAIILYIIDTNGEITSARYASTASWAKLSLDGTILVLHDASLYRVVHVTEKNHQVTFTPAFTIPGHFEPIFVDTNRLLVHDTLYDLHGRRLKLHIPQKYLNYMYESLIDQETRHYMVMAEDFEGGNYYICDARTGQAWHTMGYSGEHEGIVTAITSARLIEFSGIVENSGKSRLKVIMKKIGQSDQVFINRKSDSSDAAWLTPDGQHLLVQISKHENSHIAVY